MLSDVRDGRDLQVTAVLLGPAVTLRLAELGIRPGQRVQLSHRSAGGGRVLMVDDSRIALDSTTAGGIEVAELVAS